MGDRAQLKRIATVRHLREVQEKQEAKRVALAVAAVAEAEQLLVFLDRESDRFRRELAEALSAGLPSDDVTMSHVAWLDMRAKHRLVEIELEARRKRLDEANEQYRAARISRRKMEKWEEKVGDAIRVEDGRKLAVMVDEIAVQRHGWRRS
jgi:flagellar export protein FliJ